MKNFKMTTFVNLNQTKEERRETYRELRERGLTPSQAYVLRDWTTNHIIQFLMAVNED